MAYQPNQPPAILEMGTLVSVLTIADSPYTLSVNECVSFNQSNWFVFHLPAANSVEPGQWCAVMKNNSAGGSPNAKIFPNGLDTIMGIGGISFTSFRGTLIFFSDGISNWHVTGWGYAI